MAERETLIKEINGLPDFMIKQLLDIIHYIKLGIENEYVPKSSNACYSSEEFKAIVGESIVEYLGG